MGLMEQFANPETMHSLSMSDKLAATGITALMGMGITFCILLLLWLIIAILTRAIRASEKKAEASAQEAVPAPAKPAAAPAPAAAVSEPGAGGGTLPGAAPGDDAALIAVITAAIAAYEGDSAMKSDLVVRRIRRVAGAAPVWAREGRQECIESRRIV
ncbi:MAG: OadG family transporter subunit [Anaerovoracaceae bacterium]|jgi:sodium pump decarboxylase gamma subunit